jgi:hypothetical protein
MRKSFLQWHCENGGDVCRIDGYSHEEPKAPREKNPNLKQHNYKFINQIEVVDAEYININIAELK